jgi:hypothetical protein
MARLGKVEGGAVGADVGRDRRFSWVVPEVAGTYAKEAGLVRAQLTAYECHIASGNLILSENILKFVTSDIFSEIEREL